MISQKDSFVQRQKEDPMNDTRRLEAFESMLQWIQGDLERTQAQMEQLKAAGKERSATYRQLMGNKLLYKQMLQLYRLYGLLDEGEPE